MITLDAALQLPADMVWSDELAWSAVAQSLEYTISGALVIDEATKQAGRPITLSLPTEYGDCERGLVLALAALSAQRQQHTLTLHDGRQFTVRWRHSDGPAVTGSAVVGYADPLDSDQYALELKFIEV